MRKLVIGMIVLLSLSANATEVIFEGYPAKKIEINEGTSNTRALTNTEAAEFKVTITKEGDSYYWATRGNLEVIPVQSGAYITFLAVNGAGYVRTMTPEVRQIFKQMSAEEQAKQFLYFEHLVNQMGSVTYYGR